LLHAPVVISVGRLLKAIKAKVPQKFANQVFVNELSATIAHECGHAFGLVISAKGGADKHPSDPRNVMSRDTFDSLGGINSLPTGEANWEKLLKGYQLPAFTNADVKAMHGAIKELTSKAKRKKLEWKFPGSRKSQDRVPDPKHFEP